MGAIISRFRRKPSTLDVLQRIQEDISAIEESKADTRQRQQHVGTVILAYSVLLYIVVGLILYWYYLPRLEKLDLTHRLLCLIPLLLFPFIVYALRRLLRWYYERQIMKRDAKLTELRKRREKILDEVQEKETYKTAKQILERFAPEKLLTRRSPARISDTSLVASQYGSTPAAGLRQRTPLRPPASLGLHTRGGPSRVPQPTPARSPSGAPLPPLPAAGGPGPALPRPVLPRERGYMDRLMDYLVGDGPANRYALICRQCRGHNGMALKEEFEYLAFRCCYCFQWNPARKQRPSAPRLPAAPTSGESLDESDTTDSGSDSVAEMSPASNLEEPAGDAVQQQGTTDGALHQAETSSGAQQQQQETTSQVLQQQESASEVSPQQEAGEGAVVEPRQALESAQCVKDPEEATSVAADADQPPPAESMSAPKETSLRSDEDLPAADESADEDTEKFTASPSGTVSSLEETKPVSGSDEASVGL